MAHNDAENDPPVNDHPPRKSWISRGGSLLMEYSVILALLIIGVGIVGIMAFPAIQNARRAAQLAAQRQQAMANLKQIGLAMHNYSQLHPTIPRQEIPLPVENQPSNQPALAP